MALAEGLAFGFALGRGVSGVAMLLSSDTVMNVKLLASSASRVAGIASIVPG